MTLRELIDQVTDYDSESIVLDYELQLQEFTGFNQNVKSQDISINEEAKLINIKFAHTRRTDIK